MKKNVLIACLAAGLFACNQPEKAAETTTENTEEVYVNPFEGIDQEALLAKVNEFEGKVFKQDGTMDVTNANLLIEGYILFGDSYPEAAESANLLFKAAEVSLGMNQAPRALGLYQKVYKNYPEFEKRPFALFLQAFIYENNLGRLDDAKLTYEKFLVEFPDHAMADDATYSLANLGKSPDELIKEFEAKSKKES
jgi:tetratricopeptide (TPR) repeat protein